MQAIISCFVDLLVSGLRLLTQILYTMNLNSQWMEWTIDHIDQGYNWIHNLGAQGFMSYL